MTDRWTDGQMAKASYINAMRHLKDVKRIMNDKNKERKKKEKRNEKEIK